MSTIDYLKQQMQAMGMEMRALADKRIQLDQTIQDINMRLAHLTGAMSEIDRMVKEIEEGESDEARENGNSRISDSVEEPSGE